MYKKPQGPDPQTRCKGMTPIHAHLSTMGTDALKCTCRLWMLPVVPKAMDTTSSLSFHLSMDI